MFGGFGGMLPIRLGGSATEGWTAAQHARVCADMVAVARTVPAAVVTYTVSSGTVTVQSFRGANGIGPGDAPAVTSSGTGLSAVTFLANYLTDRDEAWSYSIETARASAHGTTAVAAEIVSITPRVVNVRTFATSSGAAADAKVTVTIYAQRPALGRAPRIGDYDGATDKQDSTTERIPYAWTWYQELTSMLGSAFTDSRTSLIHVKKLALARDKAAVTRNTEKIGTNQNPATAYDSLGEWVEFLQIPLSGLENAQEIRTLCAQTFQFARGNDKVSVDEAISDLLGDILIDIQRNYGTLGSPPTLTYWPGVNPGDSTYSLGGGTWSSERSFLVARVNRPASSTEAEFLHLMNVKYFRLCDDLLPAWATFNWAVGTSGFLLDISQLDFDGL